MSTSQARFDRKAEDIVILDISVIGIVAIAIGVVGWILGA